VIFSLQAFITLRVSVSGYVVDQNGKPLEGVTVTVIGSERSTTTDSKGRFMLSANENEALALSFSLPGYGSKEILAVADKPVTIKLNKLPSEKLMTANAESKKEEPVASKDHHLRVQDHYFRSMLTMAITGRDMIIFRRMDSGQLLRNPFQHFPLMLTGHLTAMCADSSIIIFFLRQVL
jgi:hypothetical protein